MKMVGPKKQEWQSIPGCGDVIVHGFFSDVVRSPIFPKNPQLPESGRTGRTPKTQKQEIILMEPDGASMYGFFYQSHEVAE